MFDFASLQGATGQTQLERLGQRVESTNTFFVLVDYRSQSPSLLSKARAALFVLNVLGAMRPVLFLSRLFPRFVLDFVYEVIARNRYRIFGRTESCWLPSPKFSDRFLDREGMGDAR
jgi:predicted DCC family thiol-disulfide oxidoreductase YuxK